MIEITRQPISPEVVINRAKSARSGCVVTYVGLIRNESHGKTVRSVEYQDAEGNAQRRLQEIADQVRARWPVNSVAITHRTGVLQVGDINLVVAIAAAHRKEGLAACRHAVDLFKERLPTWKKETYQDGSTLTGD
jgi:molybdopterin synthase catalytic subunit